MLNNIYIYLYFMIIFVFKGAIIVDDQPAVAEGNDEPIETPIQENYVPKISQAELENARLAPVYINCKTPGQVVITCK